MGEWPSTMVRLMQIGLVAILAVQLFAAGAEVEGLKDFELGDLGEDAAIDSGEFLGEGEMEFLQKEAGDYAAVKKKLEGEIKSINAGVKKKKVLAKKEYDAQMKKYSKTFVKLYSSMPAKGGHKDALESPLGNDGMGGMSDMSRWAYTRQIASWTEKAHKMVESKEIELEENRYNHFGTAVCAEVLKTKVTAIGDLQYNSKRNKFLKVLKNLKFSLARKLKYDRADMDHKVAGYKLWSSNEHTKEKGGFMGFEDKTKPRMMSDSGVSKTAAGQMGELKQAAHWAYAQQRTHSYEVYETQVKKWKGKLKKLRAQHDLTLCRTGRKPQSPELKYRLTQAKKELKGELSKLPSKTAKKAEKKAVKKAAKKAEKKAAKKGELGENAASSAVDENIHLKNRMIIEFHKMIDASGGHESIEERAKMWQDMRHDEASRESQYRKEYGVE